MDHPRAATGRAGDAVRNARRTGLLALGVLLACARTPPPVPSRLPAPPPASVPTPPLLPAPRPSSGTLPGGAGPLAWRITGAGPDTVLIPLGAWLDPALAPLGNDRWTVVFYDPRHRGRSHALADSAAGAFEGDVADLEAVRQFLGISRAAVIGYDYYAGVAAAWAARHPDAATRVVLLSPMEPADSLSQRWSPPERWTRLDTARARQLVKDRAAGRDTTDPRRYCEAFWRVNWPLFVADTIATPPAPMRWCEHPNEAPPRLADAAALAISSLGDGADLGARAAGLRAPLLVIHGRQDLVANPEGAREWARRIPDARILFLANVGHLPHLEASPVLIEAIAGFLEGRWPVRAAPPEEQPRSARGRGAPVLGDRTPARRAPVAHRSPPDRLYSPPRDTNRQRGHGRPQQVEADQALQGRDRRQAGRALHEAHP